MTLRQIASAVRSLKGRLFFLFLFLLLAQPAFALEITSHVDKPTVSTSKTIDQLTRIYHTGMDTYTENKILGLTKAEYSSSVDFSLQYKRKGSCFCVTGVDFHVDVSIDEIHIYLAKELKTQKCVKEAVRGHEFRHVRDYKEIVALAKEMARKRFAALESSLPGLGGSDCSGLRDHVRRRAQEELKQIDRFYKRQTRKRAHSLDEDEKNLVCESCGRKALSKVCSRGL